MLDKHQPTELDTPAPNTPMALVKTTLHYFSFIVHHGLLSMTEEGTGMTDLMKSFTRRLGAMNSVHMIVSKISTNPQN